ncbi:MAG TPA: rod shape-determining protein RodA [Gammaproteobacteria bacterium]|jgi:rod shape determining protein RodA|nr:rod shape-determining protein RodA [Gammaproteobacteria bacterium]
MMAYNTNKDIFSLKPSEGLQQRLHIDFPLLLAFLAIFMISLTAIYSASNSNIDAVVNQAIKILISISAMAVVAQFSPLSYGRVGPWLFLLCLVLLILVLVIGETRNGATRWLNIGISFQPSELMKIAMPLMIARYIANGALPPTVFSVGVSITIVLVPSVLIMLEPDLGTSILIAFSGLVVIFLSGLKKRYLAVALGLLLASLPLMWSNMHPFQKNRVLAFLNPGSDPTGSGYHLIQSKIAIGSGGLFGKGWLNSTQGQLDFLPERTTDFIFAILAEEFGFLGISLLIGIYLFIIGRGIMIAINAQDLFSRLLASSISLTFFVYVFVNIAMTTGLLPVVGIPLPLISSGGTSMVTLMIGLGMLMSVQTHKRLVEK